MTGAIVLTSGVAAVYYGFKSICCCVLCLQQFSGNNKNVTITSVINVLPREREIGVLSNGRFDS